MSGPGNDPPPPLDLAGSPLGAAWQQPVHNIAWLDVEREVPSIGQADVRERHAIYCGLLMALVWRFWNGNNRGAVGVYPWRSRQRDPTFKNPDYFRYRGDGSIPPNPNCVPWDRYLGHNIGCLAVDGRGQIIDFDFNHNHIFRSSVEHAEARVARRLFSLTNIQDSWQTGDRIPGKSPAFSLNDVTIYTSLESCAQCSGIMALARVKQVVFLQNDPGQYRVGNIMFNLAGRDALGPLSTLPIPAEALGLACMGALNDAYRHFVTKVSAAKASNTPNEAYFRSMTSAAAPDYDTSITSFLCTDDAYAIFAAEARSFLGAPSQAISHPAAGHAIMTNAQCFEHARNFYHYADIEGFRGTPHKL